MFITRLLHRLLLLLPLASIPAMASDLCPAEQAKPQVPTDLALCAALDPIIRKPSALPLNEYEAQLSKFLGGFCHRREDAGWVRDETVRDTGPFIATLGQGSWSGVGFGTHAPVVIWYSPEMLTWLRQYRGHDAAPNPPAVPDGAVMVKEMYPAPASRCRGIDPLLLKPTSGAALMVRDHAASNDGWFWGWYGWGDTSTDWPPRPGDGLPYMGFGQYCMNCHASAQDNLTFASLANIKGEPGRPINDLSQDFYLNASDQNKPPPQRPDLHALIAEGAKVQRAEPPPANRAAFMVAIGLPRYPIPSDAGALAMPSATYDNVWAGAGGPSPHGLFLTSDQCLGCHSAGTTGLRYDMTEPTTDGLLLNLSPYGSWRYTPMGLAGRDPVFFAQLASETQAFHPTRSPQVQEVCLGCHGVMGERQFQIDKTNSTDASCPSFERAKVSAIPYPPDNPSAPFASYGALAREGVSCLACHRMSIGTADDDKVKGEPWNHCALQRQASLNQENTGFARTFTGSFLVDRPNAINGPFADPKIAAMHTALGMEPVHNATIESSEACGSCHTVHLPVYRGDTQLGTTYEQTTYAEWAFSAYRTGATPDGPLPFGPGTRAKSCQGCHMPNTSDKGGPYISKMASIQEITGFQQTENTGSPADFDLPYRSGYAKHLLVGLNYFLVKMAGQFAAVLGVPTSDPMLVDMAPDPRVVTTQVIVDQATKQSADIAIEGVSVGNGVLNATVRVTNKTGHKFPSGVSFRRAFIEFDVLDTNGNSIWASGRTNDAGVLIDDKRKPIAGEYWWKSDCSARIDPEARAHQPHYRVIGRQDQAQIFEELVTAPPKAGPAQCGFGAKPSGETTTSFLSICAKLKDNRLLPDGYLPTADRTSIAQALGAHEDLAQDAGSVGTGDDPGYRTGGFSTVSYRVPLAGLSAKPASVMATLHYQATPPYFLQDRFCSAHGDDTARLAYVTSGLSVGQSPIAGWKLKMVTTGPVRVP